MAEEAPTTTQAPTTDTAPAAAAPAPNPGAEPAALEAPKSLIGEAKPEAAPAFDAGALKLPEGVEMTEQATELFKSSGISQENAQKFLDYHAEAIKELSEGPRREWDAIMNKWQGEIKSDPEFGGAKLDATMKMVGKALDSFGDPGVRQALNETGAGNNPAIFRTFAKMAAALSEGKTMRGEPSTTKPRSIAEAMWPNLKQGNT